ncbi:MAG: hypothetical protein LQ345_002001 [Seirophora villosa]|nr:MAG: hypothetical protein LQ345_002001 [Seirophora villosa]
MTPTLPTTKSPPAKPDPPKLPRLPSNARIQKRPLLRPPIPSPFTSAAHPKIVYISTRTPFISAVKRVRKLLAQTQARAAQSTRGKQPPDLVNGKGSDGEKLRALERSIVAAEEEEGEGSGKGGKKEVVLKATSRAIERALELGLFFQEQEDLVVRLRTGTAGAVDDVVVEEEEEEEGKGKSKKKKKRVGKRKGKGSGGKVAGGGGGAGDEEMKDGEPELPETRIRKVSVLEVAITLK